MQVHITLILTLAKFSTKKEHMKPTLKGENKALYFFDDIALLLGYCIFFAQITIFCI
jgi:hypothetical protein